LRYGGAELDLCSWKAGALKGGRHDAESFHPRDAARAVAVIAATAPATAAVDPLTLVSGPSPFAPGCEGAPQTGTAYINAEVEPWVDVNLADDDNLVGTGSRIAGRTGAREGTWVPTG
jgi:hypothetical protein